MIKAAIQLVAVVALFFGTWFALSQVNWVGIFHIKQNTASTEKKLGDLIWQAYSQNEEELHSVTLTTAAERMVFRICRYNGIDSTKIHLHVFNNDEINAFTLPNNHIVVYTGLINASANEEEVLGVLGHEMAHMEKNHVMKKMVKEMGLSVLISMTSSKGGGEVMKKLIKMVTSSAYDRDLEKEADITSVDYMLKANINPEPFADFLYRLANEDKNIPHQLQWISTHPDSKERAKYILDYAKGKPFTKQPVLTTEEWQKIKEKVADIKAENKEKED